MASPFVANIASKIQKIPTKARLYGFGGVLLVIGVLFIYFVHIPRTTQIKQLEKKISVLQDTIRSNDEKIKKLDDLRAEVKTREEQLRLLTEQLPPGTEVSSLLAQIQNLVSQSGLSLKLWRPEKRTSARSATSARSPASTTG